jgi:hypothetical protein
MRNRRHGPEKFTETEVLASYGEAGTLDGKLEIVGGTAEERAAASNWMQQFLEPSKNLVRRSTFLGRLAWVARKRNAPVP